MEPQTAKTTELVATGQRRYVPNYAPKEMILDRGEGARVWDTDGNEYVDLGTGISVTSLGHGDPELARALSEQAGRLWHTSNLYFVEPAVRLAEELCEASFAERVFFCNSGAEANEAAIKLARKHASLRHGPEKREIVTFHNGFHGRTLATVTATAQPKYQEGFGPLPGGFRYCDYNDAAALDDAIGERTCAVLVEPIQGEGGVVPAEAGFLTAVAERCRAHDALLMLDEIQSGLARTGRLFAYRWEEGLVPDVVTLAKALGGGLPIGAMLVGPRAAETFQPGSHGSTFGGNPIAAAVARVVLRRMRSAELLANGQRRAPGREAAQTPRRAAQQDRRHRRGARKGSDAGCGAARRMGRAGRSVRRGVPSARGCWCCKPDPTCCASCPRSTSPTPSSTTGWIASKPR